MNNGDECPLCCNEAPTGWRERAQCHEECLAAFDADLAIDRAIDAARDEVAT